MPSTAENVGRDTVSPANLGTDVAQGEPVDAPVSELLAQTQICQEKGISSKKILSGPISNMNLISCRARCRSSE